MDIQLKVYKIIIDIFLHFKEGFNQKVRLISIGIFIYIKRFNTFIPKFYRMLYIFMEYNL